MALAVPWTRRFGYNVCGGVGVPQTWQRGGGLPAAEAAGRQFARDFPPRANTYPGGANSPIMDALDLQLCLLI